MTALPSRLAADPFETLRGVLLDNPPDAIAHDDFALYPAMRAGDETAQAAVLVPVVAGPEPALLFTLRTANLARHSGQVSFPGGRREAGDGSAIQTALRETLEETGIAPGFVRVAGFLPRYRTVTGFDITPVVGVVMPGFALKPDPREVAEIFQVPLGFFLDPANRGEGRREVEGMTRVFPLFEAPGEIPRTIWGVTAALLVDLVGRLAAAQDAIHAP